MSKKDREEAMVDSEAMDPMATVAVEDDAAKMEHYKQQKKEAAERHKAKVAAEKAARIENAQKLKEQLESAGVWDGLDEELKAFVEKLGTKKVSTGGRSNLFNTLFGADPKVGDSISLEDAFNKTLKGKATIDYYVKRWVKQGTIVTFVPNQANMLKSTYVIEALSNN